MCQKNNPNESSIDREKLETAQKIQFKMKKRHCDNDNISFEIAGIVSANG